MILGLGSDLVDIRRIERALSRYGDRFIDRCFTAVERQKAQKAPTFAIAAASLAKRFAAKEACAKALGTGFRNGIYLRDIGVENDAQGRPVLALTGGALERLKALAPGAKVPTLHLSLTDEPPLAKAIVIVEGEG